MGPPGRASAEHGARMACCGRRSCLARSCLWPRVGVRAITQYRKMQREGLRGSAWPNIYFGSKHKLHMECTMDPRPGPARRRGRGERDGTGRRFRQPDRTPFFRLTPAFGLRSLRKNGYVLHTDPRALTRTYSRAAGGPWRTRTDCDAGKNCTCAPNQVS